MIRHYYIRKYIQCELSGETCGEITDYKKPITPDCEECDYYQAWKAGNPIKLAKFGDLDY